MSTKVQSKGEKRLNRFLNITAWVCISVGIGTLLVFYLFTRRNVTTNDAQVRQYITPVSSKVSGYIEEVRFEENQFVHKGDTLVVIDNRQYRHQVEEASANLQSTSESVAIYESAARSKASSSPVIDAEIEAANVEIWKLEQDYVRFKNLVEQDAVTVQQFEQVEAKYKQAKSKLLSLEKQKAVIEISTSAEQTKIAPARSQIGQKEALLKNAELILEYSYVIAPYDGWVGTKNIQPGQYVKEGQALVQVVSKEKWIVVNLKETQIGEFDIHKTIEITADAYPKIKFKGKVESLSPAAGSEFTLIKPDNATGNFVKIEQRIPVKVILEETSEIALLRSGMNVYFKGSKN